VSGSLRSEDGYTITEVLVVLIIVGLLAGIAFPLVGNSVKKAREATLRTNLTTLRTVIDDYHADHLSYPENLSVLVDEGYIRDLPLDTVEKDQEEWKLILSDDGTGIIDIKSRSTNIALDGSNYADW